jgi:hypothetical protein
MPKMTKEEYKEWVATVKENGTSPQLRAEARIKALETELAALKEAVRLSKEKPPAALLDSMATCLDHGHGLNDKETQHRAREEMFKLWQEVVGQGYYRGPPKLT